jgi:hypothetical protein
MSDIQDLIHKITMDSMERGKVVERERIIKLLEAEQLHDPDVTECHCGSWREAVEIIKGETNGN